MRKTIFMYTILLGLLLLAPERASAEKTIFLINSYHRGYTWVSGYADAFIKEIGDTAKIVEFDMDTKRLSDSSFDERSRLALERLDIIKPDVVVTGDDNALKLLGSAIANRGYPLIYLGMNNNPRAYISSTHKATGVLERPLLKRSIIYIREILGSDFHNCLVLFDIGTTSSVVRKTMFDGGLEATFADINVHLEQIETWDQWKATVSSAKENGFDAIILGLYQRVYDSNGNHVPESVVLEWTSANTPIIPFGFWANNVGKDQAVGGLVLSPIPQGRTAAQMVKLVLEGEEIGDIHPIIADQGQFLFSRSGLEKWNVKLPRHISRETKFID